VFGEGLEGNKEIELGPGETKKYELYFFPLRVFNSQGTVSFTNTRVGETFYELNLDVADQPPIKLPAMKAELGKTVTRYIQLENPTALQVTVSYTVSNPDVFDVISDNFEIAPYGT